MSFRSSSLAVCSVAAPHLNPAQYPHLAEGCLTIAHAVYAEQLAVKQKSSALSSPSFKETIPSKELFVIMRTTASLSNLDVHCKSFCVEKEGFA